MAFFSGKVSSLKWSVAWRSMLPVWALAASTRRRKANKGAPADVEATEPAAE